MIQSKTFFRDQMNSRCESLDVIDPTEQTRVFAVSLNSSLSQHLEPHRCTTVRPLAGVERALEWKMAVLLSPRASFSFILTALHAIFFKSQKDLLLNPVSDDFIDKSGN